MVRTLTALMFALGLALTAPLFAEEPPTPDTPKPDTADEEAPAKLPRVMKPFLWRVEGGVPCYLFGTVHVTDARVLAMHPLAKEAYQKADVLGLEIDLLKDSAAQINAMRLPEGQVFEEIVSEALIARLDARLEKIGPLASREKLAASNISNLTPAAWGVVVSSLSEQMKNMGTPMLDAQLYIDALNAKKTIVAMEKPEEQGALFSVLTNEESVIFLEAMLDSYDELDNGDHDLSAQLIEIYLSGDVDALLKVTNEMLVPKGALTQALLDKIWAEISFKRNARIAKKLVALRAANPTKRYFIAVGTLHLSGPKSVQHYLKEAGVSTTRVTDTLGEDETTPPAKKEEPAREPAGAGAK